MHDPSDQTEPKPTVRAISPPVEIPVYNCIVLVGPAAESGIVRARVANLDGLEASGRSEREALQQLIPAFKKRLAELHASGGSIPWLDPPRSAEPGEQQRLIAVHL